MVKLTKSQARRRLDEAATKVSLVFMEGDRHLTNADLSKLMDIRMKLLNMAKKLK